MNTNLTVKKITLINQRVEQLKESMVFTSGRVSNLNHILHDFKIDPRNPIMVSADILTIDYRQLAQDVGNLVKSIEQAEKELMVSDDN